MSHFIHNGQVDAKDKKYVHKNSNNITMLCGSMWGIFMKPPCLN